MTILNERPTEMSFSEYRSQLKPQKQNIKQAKKGYLFWSSLKSGTCTRAKMTDLKKKNIAFT